MFILFGPDLLDRLIVCVVTRSIEFSCDTIVLPYPLIKGVLVPLKCLGIACIASGVWWCLIADRASGSFRIGPWFDLTCGWYDEGMRLHHRTLLGVDIHILAELFNGPLSMKEFTIIGTGTIQSGMEFGLCVHL